MNFKKTYIAALLMSLTLSPVAVMAQDTSIGSIISEYAGTDSSISSGLSSLGIQDLSLEALMQNDEFLTAAVASVNNYLPMSAGQGVTVKHVDIDAKSVTLSADYDESSFSVKTAKNNPAIFKSMVKSAAKKNSDAQMLLSVLRSVNRDVTFKIHGAKSNADAAITFTAKEIQSLADKAE